MPSQGNVTLSHSLHRSCSGARHSVRSGGHANRLEGDVLRTLLYFDLFGHPLRLHEVDRFLPSNVSSLVDLQEACSSQISQGSIVSQHGFYYLKGRSATIVTERLKKEQRARRMLLAAHFMAHIVAAIPFVRAVFLSGELSKGVASTGGDIDFYIVTSPHRVWIVRTLCTLFKKVFLFNRKKFFCYNHIVSGDHLEVAERNLYTAMEIVTLVPLKNNAQWEEVQRVNSWTRSFLPNGSPVPQGTRINRPSIPFLERVLCLLLHSSTFDRMDSWLLARWRRAWERRYPVLGPEDRAKLFRCSAHLSTAYAKDFPHTLLEQYSLSLREYGLIDSQEGTQPGSEPSAYQASMLNPEPQRDASAGNRG